MERRFLFIILLPTVISDKPLTIISLNESTVGIDVSFDFEAIGS